MAPERAGGSDTLIGSRICSRVAVSAQLDYLVDTVTSVWCQQALRIVFLSAA